MCCATISRRKKRRKKEETVHKLRRRSLYVWTIQATIKIGSRECGAGAERERDNKRKSGGEERGTKRAGPNGISS
jgi:hypothetical protein